jgi:hypothetical protein
MFRASPSLTLLFAALAIVTPARADDLAFITMQAPLNRLAVYDPVSMTEVASITGFGVEPSRMVANPDRSRLYVVSRILAASPQPAEMRVHMVSPAQRRILRTAVVGLSVGRTIAISPDGTRLYVWKQTFPPQAIALAVLDAATLAEVGLVSLPWALCGTTHKEIATAPDGRIVASGCVDGLRVIDPSTLAVATVPIATDLLLELIGFSPNGQEVYLRHTTTASNQNARLAAIDLVSGTRSEVTFALPDGSPALFGAVPWRMLRVQRPTDPPGNPTVFLTYPATAGGSPPIASTPASALSPPNRRLTRLTSLGTPAASIFGVSESGGIGIFGNQRLLRRVTLDQSPPGEPIAIDGETVEVAPSGTPLQLSDIIFARPLLEDGFE